MRRGGRGSAGTAAGLALLALFTLAVPSFGQFGNPEASREQVIEWLRELKPLPKVHYSWPVPNRLLRPPDALHPIDPLLLEYVRITHAVSLRVEGFKREQVDAAVLVCHKVNQANPKIPASIGLNCSPWHRRFDPKAPPTDTGPTHAAELRLFDQLFESFKHRLAYANRMAGADVRVSALLLDSERFKVRKDDKAWNDAIRAKHTAFAELVRSHFPDARIEWYSRGAVGPSAAETGWSQAPHMALGEPGDSFAISLYRVPEIQTSREAFRRTVANADKHGIEDVTPWVALASGYRRTIGDMSTWSFEWNYDLMYSWQLGAEINHPWFSAPVRHERFGPWNRAKVVVFYPEPFGRAQNWGTHFVAYVRGAQLVRVLPGDEAWAEAERRRKEAASAGESRQP